MVVGIGQSMRGDDEAGLAAVRLWRDAPSYPIDNSSLKVELAESPGTGLLNLIHGLDAVILVDGVQSGAEPGTIHLLSEAELGMFLAGANSAHGWGVAETLGLGRVVEPGSLPETIILIGIEIEQVGLGTELSPSVAAALPRAANLIAETVEKLRVG